ncbi:MAG: class I SAM-dependent methyltransferase [Spirochaetaceae bacterium]
MDYFDKESLTWDEKDYRVVRAKTIAKTIQSKVRLKTDYIGLDFGCGTGLLGLHFVEKSKEFTFLDISPGMIEQVKDKTTSQPTNKISTLVLDITKNDLEDKYDFIVSLQALHHIENYQKVLDKLCKSLLPGGYLCISDLETEDGSFHPEEVVPHNGFDTQKIEQILTTYRLKKISISSPYINKNLVDGVEKEFPVFLAIFQKPQ